MNKIFACFTIVLKTSIAQLKTVFFSQNNNIKIHFRIMNRCFLLGQNDRIYGSQNTFEEKSQNRGTDILLAKSRAII